MRYIILIALFVMAGCSAATPELKAVRETSYIEAVYDAVDCVTAQHSSVYNKVCWTAESGFQQCVIIPPGAWATITTAESVAWQVEHVIPYPLYYTGEHEFWAAVCIEGVMAWTWQGAFTGPVTLPRPINGVQPTLAMPTVTIQNTGDADLPLWKIVYEGQ